MTVLDRMVQVVSIAIVIVAGLFVLAVVPYVQAYDQLARTRSAATARPAAAAPAATPAPAATAMPEWTPQPAAVKQAAAQPEAEDGEQEAAAMDALLARTLERAAAATPSVSAAPGVLDEQSPVEGLTLAPTSSLMADYTLSSMVYPEGGMRMPALIQHDYKTPVATLNGRDVSVWTSGCGAAAVSMVVSCLTGENNQTPYTLFRWAAEHGMYKGYGLDHDALTRLAALYGVSGKWIEPDADAILAALKAGCPVIAHMGRGEFTANGHYIALRGIAPDGTIYVNDPATLEHSYETFSIEQIIAESKSDDPFMICAAPGNSPPI